MPKTAIKITPSDHGQRMSLEDFEFAEVEEGHIYELSRGVITVSEVPKPRHFLQADAIMEQLYAYKLAHRGKILGIATGSECKILIAGLESERHPDVAVYTAPPPEGTNPWPDWIPAIVIEVVSPGSEQRDYFEKREEYLQFGVREYWIIDAEKKEMLVLRRSAGQWAEQKIRPPKKYRCQALPGLEFNPGAVFDAVKSV